MSISFRGSILIDEATNQTVVLDTNSLQEIYQHQFVPQNNAVLAQMQRVLCPNHNQLYNYMCNQISRYTNEFNWILSAVHQNPNSVITCTITRRRGRDSNGKEYAYYSFPQYADNCYEYALRDELDRRLGPLMPCKIYPAPGVEINIYYTFINQQAIMFRNPGSVSGRPFRYDVSRDAEGHSYISKYHFENLGDMICADLAACNIQCFQTQDIRECLQPSVDSRNTLFCWVYGDMDYHFYRYEPQFGVWSHKPGMMIPRCIDAKGNIIHDPRVCSWNSVDAPNLYSDFGGYIVASIPYNL